MRSRPALALALALLLAGPAAARPPSKALPLGPCQLGGDSSPVRVAARCGTLEVPEDRSRPGGRTIAVHVAVVDAESTSARPDPLFLLAGGPGQAASSAFPLALAAFKRVGRSRDLVLVDQRGTGLSGRLGCPALEDPRALDRSEAEELAAVERCAARLSARADLRAYGTEAFARDLDAVRAALGYEKVNLFGASYGTRAALVYARTFPDRVRALVLDGVAPMEMAIGETFGEDAQRALEKDLARCAADPACAARYPALPADLRALVAELDRKPARVRLRDPLTAEPVAFELKGGATRSIVFLLLYAPETTSLLPALLREARAGDLAPLAAQGLIGGADAAGQIALGLQLSVLCAEDVPFYGPAPAGGAFLGNLVRDAFQKRCARWPHAAPDPAFHRPLRSGVPALLLSGEDDPVTPPRWAEEAARDLPRSRHLVVPGAGHGTFVRGCMPRLIARFLEAGSAEGLDASCLERWSPAPFFLDLAGPGP